MAEYEKEIDVWAAQGLKSFVKARPMFAQTGYDSRLRFSFVQHSGRPECKQEAAIDVYLPFVKSGTDDKGNSGVSALELANMLCSGMLVKKAQMAREKQKNTGAQYAEEIFACIGGSKADKETGKPVFKKFSIAPSSKAGSFLFRASYCEGEISTTGGYQPKNGAQWKHIMVSVAISNAITLGEDIKAWWDARRAMVLLQDVLKNANFRQNPPAPQPQSTAPATPVPVAKQTPPPPPTVIEKKPDLIWTFVDQKCFGLMGTACSPQEAVTMASNCFRALKAHSSCYICEDKNEGLRLRNEILDVEHVAKNQYLHGVVLKNKAGDTNVLNVMVSVPGEIILGG